MLGSEFLDAVFAEEALAGGVGFEDGFGGVHFADGHEGDGGGAATGAVADGGDFFAEGFEVGGDGHATVSLEGYVLIRWAILDAGGWGKGKSPISCIQLGSFIVLRVRNPRKCGGHNF